MLREGLETHAVVYDATSPALSGSAFVQQLRAEGNATPVLLMTKPFRLLDFGDRLLRLLADHARSAISASGHPSADR